MVKRQQTLGMYARTHARRYFNKFCKGNPEMCRFISEESWTFIHSNDLLIQIKEDIEKGIIRIPQSMRKEFRSHLMAGLSRDESIFKMIIDHIDKNLEVYCLNELALLETREFAKQTCL